METNQSGVLGGVFLIALVVIYLLPFILAKKADHPRTAPIFALNLLLGWTLIGWVAALIWALSPPLSGAQELIIRPDGTLNAGSSDSTKSASSAGSSLSPPFLLPAIRLKGDGDFLFDIVGESFYDAALQQMIVDFDTEAVDGYLVRETDNPHDAFAVAVYLDGRKVGHLDRQHARLFRDVFDPLYPDMQARFLTRGRLIGWPGGPIGVKLDIRLPFRKD